MSQQCGHVFEKITVAGFIYRDKVFVDFVEKANGMIALYRGKVYNELHSTLLCRIEVFTKQKREKITLR